MPVVLLKSVDFCRAMPSITGQSLPGGRIEPMLNPPVLPESRMFCASCMEPRNGMLFVLA